MKMSSTRRLEKLLDRYRNGGMDRRAFLGLTAVLDENDVDGLVLSAI